MHPTAARFGDAALLSYLVGEENAHEHDLIDIEHIRILVVDDEEMIRTLLMELFAADVYEVATAVDGEQVLELLKAQRFDLVMTDLIMPGLVGAEVLLIAKRIDPDRPVVIMSGHTPAETVSRLTGLGADDYIAKPFDLEVVKEVVARLVQKSHATRQNHDDPRAP